MANRFQGRVPKSGPAGPEESASFAEPEVRRWPHPVETTEPAASSDTALHFIHCALSYQNQLLADIKVLLEQIRLDGLSESMEK